MTSRAVIVIVVAGLVFASCGGEESSDTTSPGEATTQVEDAGEPVDLVFISDSTGNIVRERYAELASDALDREVRLNTVDGDPEAIRTTSSDVVAEAEIIVFYHNSGEVFEPDMPAPTFERGCVDPVDALENPDYLEDPGYVGPEWTPGTPWEVVAAVPSDEDWRPYRDWLSEVWEAIWEARDGQPVVLRGYDGYSPWVGQWIEIGVEAECTAVWEGQAQTAREAAEENGAVFVSFYDLFNGPDHDEDARAKGWIGEDGFHASEEGAAAAAEALAAVGFEPNEQPGAAACGQSVRAGLSTVECDGIAFDISVPEACLQGACGVIVDVPGGNEPGEVAERHTGMQGLGNAAGYVVVQPDSPEDGWDYPVDSARIRTFIDQLIDALDLDRNRVHIGGHSLGGFMTWNFVCDHADLIASAAPLGAGTSTDEASSCDFDVDGHPAEEVDILLAHGRTDEIVPFATALAQRDLVVAAWSMTETEVLADEPTYRWTRWTSPRGTVFEFLEFDWSGGYLGNHCYPGTDAEVGCGADTPVHYGQAALDFFIAHPKDQQ